MGFNSFIRDPKPPEQAGENLQLSFAKTPSGYKMPSLLTVKESPDFVGPWSGEVFSQDWSVIADPAEVKQIHRET